MYYSFWTANTREERTYVAETPCCNIDLKTDDHRPTRRLPSVALSYDGHSCRYASAGRVVDNDDVLGKYIALDDLGCEVIDEAEGFADITRTDAQSLARRYRPALRFPGTEFTVVLPVGDYGIRFCFDDDNATVELSVMTRSDLLIHSALEMMHERTYGWLVDYATPPDEAAISAAVTAAMAQATNPAIPLCYVNY